MRLRRYGDLKKEKKKSLLTLDHPRSLVISEILEQLFADAVDRIEETLELESIPYTLNDHYFTQTRDDALTALKRAREGPKLINGSADEREDRLAVALSALAAVGYAGVKADHLPRLLGPDKYEEALDAAAQTIAYWKIAYKVGPGHSCSSLTPTTILLIQACVLAEDCGRRPAHHRRRNHSPSSVGAQQRLAQAASVGQ